MVTRVIVFVAVFCFACSASFAELKFSEVSVGAKKQVSLYITQEITRETQIKFEHALEYFTESPAHSLWTTVYLDSVGGDVEAAMDIGRSLRHREFRAVVPRGSKCLSSCTLVFVGAVVRDNLGTIGIHRPFFQLVPTDSDLSSSQVQAMYGKIRSYLDEMNIGQQLFELMMATPPEDVLVFGAANEAELLRLIPEEDPIYSELKIQQKARSLGISTVLLRKRTKWAEENCYLLYPSDPEAYVDCTAAAEWGVSVDVYRPLYASAREECSTEDAVDRRDCVFALLRRELSKQ